MQSPRSLETSSSARPPTSAAGAAFRARLERASERLLARIRMHLKRAGMARAGDLDDQAREVLQEVFFEALRSEHVYDPNRDLLAWLHAIELNVVRRHVERYGIARRRLAPEPLDEDAAAEALHERLVQAGSRQQRGPEEALAVQEEVEAVLGGLPEQHREALRLFYLEHDEDNEAVAAALGIRPGTASVRRFRALQAARKGGSR